MTTMTHGCPFCGQGHVLEVQDAWTEAEIREATIALCDCPAAEKHKEMRSIRKRVEEQFGEKSVPKFDDSFSTDVLEDLIEWAERVFDELYDKIVITMENGDKATIARSGSHVKIAREQKVKAEA